MLEFVLLWTHHGWWWGGGLFVIFFALLFLLIVLKLFWWGPRWAHRRGHPGWRDYDEEAILRRRLARGEITEPEYEHLRDVLRK